MDRDMEMEDIDRQLAEIKGLLASSVKRRKELIAAAAADALLDPDEVQSMSSQIEDILKAQAQHGRFLINGEWVKVSGMELVRTEVEYDENDDRIGVTAIYKTPIPQVEVRLREEEATPSG